MALTQQFARVAPEYLERCRASALDSPGAVPNWDPPAEDLLDAGWAAWGLIRHCRGSGAAPGTLALLERAVSGDPDGDVDFLDHDEVYDGFTDPPRLLGPTAVADIAHGLEAIDVGALLADLPASPAEAAAVCGFGPGFVGDVGAHLVEHLAAMRQFYREAAHRGWCVVVWVD
ncbi:hypothetical protein [Streptomyces sp. Root369]|uniref:hypothetical protein n=1 Tax=Streptomyces sp. Root369 TaxID=1736523 RepID=UPI00070991B2|nr:hypothetical protein [Streptomyces sp. Root369]KQW13187.1 hypothetical protein ASD08_31970 [Streptomyces sp. Root369]